MCKFQCQQCGQELIAPKSFKCAMCGSEDQKVVCRTVEKLGICELADN